MCEIKIKIHSSVGSITNSSTEIFSTATKGTLDIINDILSNLLIIGGINKPVNEIFKVRLYSEEVFCGVKRIDRFSEYSHEEVLDLVSDYLISTYENILKTYYDLRTEIQDDIDSYYTIKIIDGFEIHPKIKEITSQLTRIMGSLEHEAIYN